MLLIIYSKIDRLTVSSMCFNEEVPRVGQGENKQQREDDAKRAVHFYESIIQLVFTEIVFPRLLLGICNQLIRYPQLMLSINSPLLLQREIRILNRITGYWHAQFIYHVINEPRIYGVQNTGVSVQKLCIIIIPFYLPTCCIGCKKLICKIGK